MTNAATEGTTERAVRLAPERLTRIGFRGCEHPLYQVTPVGPSAGLDVKYCLTCAAALSGPEGWRGGFGADHYINYELIDRYGLRSSFEYWIQKRPSSRMFGDL